MAARMACGGGQTSVAENENASETTNQTTHGTTNDDGVSENGRTMKQRHRHHPPRGLQRTAGVAGVRANAPAPSAPPLNPDGHPNISC